MSINGCRYMDKQFSVSARDDRGKDFCELCLKRIQGNTYKARGQKMCHDCFDRTIPSKEIGLCSADAFPEVYDKDLGASYTSLHEKRKIMKEKGITYAHDFKETNEIHKEAVFKFGRSGDRKMSEKRWY